MNQREVSLANSLQVALCCPPKLRQLGQRLIKHREVISPHKNVVYFAAALEA